MKAIILSAGQGRRLLPVTANQPKCLIPLAGRTLLEWQIDALSASGVIEEVVVVTGFMTEKVEQLAAGIVYPNLRVRTLYNPFFAVADNLGSCYVARPEMAGGFVLLNGDTLLEPEVLGRLLGGAVAPITVTIDRKYRYDADDMKVRLDGSRLTEIGKTLPADAVDGESIGLLRFDAEGAQLFAQGIEAALRAPEGLKAWYLTVIDRLAKTGTVGALSIEGLEWGEVDFPADLRRAEELTRRWIARSAAPARRAQA